MDFHQLLLSPDLAREGETGQIKTRTERLVLICRAGSKPRLVAFHLLPKQVQFLDLLIKSHQPRMH